jgi:aspartate-semialdehyde dehydrogenase
MVNETRKILKRPDLKITATCVRVPVINSHSESINIEFENSFNLDDVRTTISNFPGIVLLDDVSKNEYPIATIATGHNDVYVGRIRRDFSVENGLNLWVVADNLRKGAASNAVQILEKLILS